MNRRDRREILSSTSFVVPFAALFVLLNITQLGPRLASWTVISVAGRDGNVLRWILLAGTYTLVFTVLSGLCAYHLAGALRGRG